MPWCIWARGCQEFQNGPPAGWRERDEPASIAPLMHDKSLESWIWDAACSIRGAKDAAKYKDYILPLIFTKRLCDVFDDELNRIAKEVGSRKKAFQLAKADHKLVRFYLPLVPDDPEQPVWSVTGTTGKEDYGFNVRIPKTDKKLLLNQRVTRIDVTDHRLQKDFASHFLLLRKFLDHLYPTAKGMKQANLCTNAMKKLKVVLPCEAEQAEIAICFKSLDQKVVVAGRKVAALQDLFRTLLHELMTAKTRVHEIEFSTQYQGAT